MILYIHRVKSGWRNSGGSRHGHRWLNTTCQFNHLWARHHAKCTWKITRSKAAPWQQQKFVDSVDGAFHFHPSQSSFFPIQKEKNVASKYKDCSGIWTLRERPSSAKWCRASQIFVKFAELKPTVCIDWHCAICGSDIRMPPKARSGPKTRCLLTGRWCNFDVLLIPFSFLLIPFDFLFWFPFGSLWFPCGFLLNPVDVLLISFWFLLISTRRNGPDT